MKKKLVLIIFIILVIPFYLNAIRLTDYTIADSKSSDLYFNGSFNLADGNQDQTSYDGLLSTILSARRSSVPMVWSMDGTGLYEFGQKAERDTDAEDGYNLLLKTSLDRYYKETKWMGFGTATGGYRKSLGASTNDDPYAHLGVGIGYGRLYNATVLAKAMRVVEDLLSYGVIKSDISDAGYLKLAEVIDRESEFKVEHGLQEYKKFWYEAMEDIFRSEGVLEKENMGALGIIRTAEILDEEFFGTRLHGWIARVGTGFVFSNYDGSESDPTLFASFEIGIPYTYRLQFSNLTEYTTILNDEVVHTISNTMSLTYEISNRVDWENNWLFNIIMPTDNDQDNLVTNTLTSGFRYYLTNSVSANLDFSLSHFEDEIDDNGNDDIEKKIFAGITYRFR